MQKHAIAIAAVLIPASASAHPEHLSGGDFGLFHLVTEPFHVALAAAALLLFLAARRALVRTPSLARSAR